MNLDLSPEDREEVLERAAKYLVEEIKKTVDLAEIITLPLDAVAAMIGLSPKQTSRHVPTRQMGIRKKGVSLRAILDYQNSQNNAKYPGK